MLTIWDEPLRYRLFAALVLPELTYAVILQSAYVAAVWQKLTGSALLGFGWQFIAFGVLLMAVLALLTIASILYYRSRADR